jgi:ribonuclease D
LQRLCVWREGQARKKNLPRSWIAKDAELLAIAQLVREHRKLAVRDLNDCDALGKALVRRHGDRLIRLANTSPDFSLIDRSLLSPPLPASLRDLMKGFRQAVQKHAEQMDISPELLARKKQLVAVAQMMQRGCDFVWPPEVQGWRRDRLATDFLEVAGRLGFKEVAENG